MMLLYEHRFSLRDYVCGSSILTKQLRLYKEYVSYQLIKLITISLPQSQEIEGKFDEQNQDYVIGTNFMKSTTSKYPHVKCGWGAYKGENHGTKHKGGNLGIFMEVCTPGRGGHYLASSHMLQLGLDTVLSNAYRNKGLLFLCKSCREALGNVSVCDFLQHIADGAMPDIDQHVSIGAVPDAQGVLNKKRS